MASFATGTFIVDSSGKVEVDYLDGNETGTIALEAVLVK